MIPVTVGSTVCGTFLFECGVDCARELCRRSVTQLGWRVLIDEAKKPSATPTNSVAYGIMRLQEFVGAAYPPRVTFDLGSFGSNLCRVHIELQWGKTSFLRGPRSLVQENWKRLLDAIGQQIIASNIRIAVEK